MEGDGYTTVLHCETLDVIGEGYEPDANPVMCEPEAARHDHLALMMMEAAEAMNKTILFIEPHATPFFTGQLIKTKLKPRKESRINQKQKERGF